MSGRKTSVGLYVFANTDTGLSPSLLVYGQLLDIPGQLVVQKEELNLTSFLRMSKNNKVKKSLEKKCVK